MKCSRFFIAIVGVCFAHSISAQDMPNTAEAKPSVPVEESCELHVWPSAGLRSVFHGWLGRGIVDGAITGRDGYPEIPKDPINTAKQVKLASQLPLATILKLPDYQVVTHDAALESRIARNSVGRIQPDAAKCYAELVLDDVFLQQDVVTGNHLKTFFRFRSFDGNTVIRSFGAFTQSNLKVFPPKLDKDNEAALRDLDSAFVGNIEQFGGFLNKPIKAKKVK